MPLTTEEKTVYLQLEVPGSLRTRLKIEALKQGMTMREFAYKILDKALKDLEKEGK